MVRLFGENESTFEGQTSGGISEDASSGMAGMGSEGMPGMADGEKLSGVSSSAEPAGVPELGGIGVCPVRTQISNLCLVSPVEHGVVSSQFVVVDAGMPMSDGHVFEAIAKRYGETARPLAVVLTHGHFDHVGALTAILEKYDVPVYAHEQELPYLTGERDYPPAHPGALGGVMSLISPIYPRRAIDLGGLVQALPDDGSVPGLPDWKWIHTPGHTPGHVSLFRNQDRSLIAGDAFTTVKQESLLAVLTQHAKVHGPPAYFTMDFEAARASVKKLASLRPRWAITGHGLAMSGSSLEEGLAHLARNFDELAVPGGGLLH